MKIKLISRYILGGVLLVLVLGSSTPNTSPPFEIQTEKDLNENDGALYDENDHNASPESAAITEWGFELTQTSPYQFRVKSYPHCTSIWHRLYCVWYWKVNGVTRKVAQSNTVYSDTQVTGYFNFYEYNWQQGDQITVYSEVYCTGHGTWGPYGYSRTLTANDPRYPTQALQQITVGHRGEYLNCQMDVSDPDSTAGAPSGFLKGYFYWYVNGQLVKTTLRTNSSTYATFSDTFKYTEGWTTGDQVSVHTYTYDSIRWGEEGQTQTITAPDVGDNDYDGLVNNYEIAIGTNPNVGDSDGDNLYDKDELDVGSNPLNPDTDGDGINDYDELNPICHVSNTYTIEDTVEYTAGWIQATLSISYFTNPNLYQETSTSARYEIPWYEIIYSWVDNNVIYSYYEDTSIIRLIFHSRFKYDLVSSDDLPPKIIWLEGWIIFHKATNSFAYEDHSFSYTQ